LRRIEIVTGRGAESWVENQTKTLQELVETLGVPLPNVVERVQTLLVENKQQQQELAKLRSQAARQGLEHLLGKVQQINGVKLLVARVEAPDQNSFRDQGDWLRDKIGSGMIVLGTVLGDKPQILVMLTPDLVKQGYHAGKLVKTLAPLIGGGGGGRPETAQAGGHEAQKLDAALAALPDLLQNS